MYTIISTTWLRAGVTPEVLYKQWSKKKDCTNQTPYLLKYYFKVDSQTCVAIFLYNLPTTFLHFQWTNYYSSYRLIPSIFCTSNVELHKI